MFSSEADGTRARASRLRRAGRLRPAWRSGLESRPHGSDRRAHLLALARELARARRELARGRHLQTLTAQAQDCAIQAVELEHQACVLEPVCARTGNQARELDEPRDPPGA